MISDEGGECQVRVRSNLVHHATVHTRAGPRNLFFLYDFGLPGVGTVIFDIYTTDLPFISIKVFDKGVCVHEHEHSTHSTVHILLEKAVKTAKTLQIKVEGYCVHRLCTHTDFTGLWTRRVHERVHTGFLGVKS